MTHITNPYIFTPPTLNRSAEIRADPVALMALRSHTKSKYIILWRGKPLIDFHEHANAAHLTPEHPLLALEGNELFLGKCEQTAYFAKDISDWEPENGNSQDLQQFLDPTTQHHELADDGHDFCELRTVLAQLSHLDAVLISTARSMFEWHKSHGFCANCGVATHQNNAGWQRDCSGCQHTHFPRTDPVVIMLITHGDKILLGRSPHWPDGMYSLLAGFLEPGETIENAVRREVFEESGIVVGKVQYLSSQPWPYPSSLMIGCHGIATTETITIDPIEIEDALWISRNDLLLVYSGTHPVINPPRKGAIAENILRNWLADRA